jgi:hypothetical protein
MNNLHFIKMSSLPIPDIQTKHQQTGFSTVFPNQTSQIVLDFHAVKQLRKTSEKQARGKIFCIFENSSRQGSAA